MVSKRTRIFLGILLIYAIGMAFVLYHVVHHRGQLSVYLRLNNVPVPAIYGPTADEG